jgi:hypothetical protein
MLATIGQWRNQIRHRLLSETALTEPATARATAVALAMMRASLRNK